MQLIEQRFEFVIGDFVGTRIALRHRLFHRLERLLDDGRRHGLSYRNRLGRRFACGLGQACQCGQQFG